MLWISLVFVVSFLLTFLITPVFIRKLKAAGIQGKDIHKKDMPKVPEMGGLAILFGFSAGLFISIPFLWNDLIFLFAAFLTILVTGIIGICDDIFGIRQKIKVFLPLFASIPLVAVQAGVHSMYIPFIGSVNFGLIYPLLFVPIAITVVSNGFNMMAGYNGLETGLGFIACVFLGIGGLITGRIQVSFLMFAMAGACLAFLMYNKYPAKVFPGDVGTFVIGAAIASAVIIGNLEMIGLIIILPLLINGLITIFDIGRGRPIQKFATLNNDGTLKPPEGRYVNALYFIAERHFKLDEKRVVWLFWSIGIIFGLISMIFLYL